MKRIAWSAVRAGDVIQFPASMSDDGKPFRGIATRNSHRAAPFGPGYGINYVPVPSNYAGEGFGGRTFPYRHALDLDYSEYEFPYGATSANRYGRLHPVIHLVCRTTTTKGTAQ